jgi:Mrp family chromosome partitioning ATPase
MISTADALWANLARAHIEHSPARVLFIGVEPGSGTTSIAAATAIGLARNLRVDVCLVEANLKRPGVANQLGLYASRGLSDVLDGTAELEDCVLQVAGCQGLRIVPGGSGRTPFPGEFATAMAADVLRTLTSEGDYVVIDAPPILGNPETRTLLNWVDGVVLVLRAGSTRTGDAKKALRILKESGVPVLGTVLNRFRSESMRLRLAGREFELDLGDVA